MNTQTKGHLVNQGGIRGHSAGDIFPYIIMLKGTLDNLKYHVIGKGRTPDYTFAHATYEQAHSQAVELMEEGV